MEAARQTPTLLRTDKEQEYFADGLTEVLLNAGAGRGAEGGPPHLGHAQGAGPAPIEDSP